MYDVDSRTPAVTAKPGLVLMLVKEGQSDKYSKLNIV